MRYVSNLPPVTTTPYSRQIGGVSRVHAVKPVETGEEAVPNVEMKAARQGPMVAVEPLERRAQSPSDRRKECRRINRQSVLVELRSGQDRRRNSAREGDEADHIDIEV